jgi:hypothetical protein
MTHHPYSSWSSRTSMYSGQCNVTTGVINDGGISYTHKNTVTI